MKKITLVLIAITFFSQIANATEYACPAGTYRDNNGRIIQTSEARYNQNRNDCERWNADFYRERTPHLYQSCIEDRNFREQQIQRGECRQIN